MKKWLLYMPVLFLIILGICIIMSKLLTAKNTAILEPNQTQAESLNAPEASANTPAISGSVDEPFVEEHSVTDSSSRLIVAAEPSDNTLELGTIDTETGEYKRITWLKNSTIVGDTASFSLSGKTLYVNFVSAKYYDTSIISDGLDKLACSFILPSGEIHAGWLDLSESEGTIISYVDVTEKLGEQSGSSFSETKVSYFGVGFASNGEYVYSNSDFLLRKDDAAYYSIPVDNIGKDYVTRLSLQHPETLLSGSGIDWNSLSSFIDDHIIAITNRTPASLSKSEQFNIILFNADTRETSSVIPDVEGRNNYCGIVSPDKTKLAFISSVGAKSQLFIVPLDGGEPIELETTVPMALYGLRYDVLMYTGYVPLEWK